MLFALLIYWITSQIAGSRGIESRRYALKATALYVVLALGGGFLLGLTAPDDAADGLLPGFIIDLIAGFFSIFIVSVTLPTGAAASMDSDRQTP